VERRLKCGASDFPCHRIIKLQKMLADPSGRAVYGLSLRLLACWDCGFESRQGRGCLLWVLSGLEGEVSATGRCFVQGVLPSSRVSFSVISVSVYQCISVISVSVYQSLYTRISVGKNVGLNKHKMLLCVSRVGFMFYLVNQGHAADPLLPSSKVF